MLETTRNNYKRIAILISVVAAGLPLWTQTTTHINFSDPGFLLLWLSIGIAACFITLFVANLNTRDMVACFTTGYVAAAIIYFVSRILISNMIHSQFLLSLAVAIGCGILSGWTGSFIWKMIRTQKKKNPPR